MLDKQLLLILTQQLCPTQSGFKFTSEAWLCIIYVVEQNAKVTLTTELILTHKSKSKTTETLEGTHAKLASLWFNDIQSLFENWGLLPAQ